MIHQEPSLHIGRAKFAVLVLFPQDLRPSVIVHLDHRYLGAILQGTDDVVPRVRAAANVQAFAVIRIDPLGAIVGVGDSQRGKELPPIAAPNVQAPIKTTKAR